jgi:hypothetical protein
VSAFVESVDGRNSTPHYEYVKERNAETIERQSDLIELRANIKNETVARNVAPSRVELESHPEKQMQY